MKSIMLYYPNVQPNKTILSLIRSRGTQIASRKQYILDEMKGLNQIFQPFMAISPNMSRYEHLCSHKATVLFFFFFYLWIKLTTLVQNQELKMETTVYNLR